MSSVRQVLPRFLQEVSQRGSAQRISGQKTTRRQAEAAGPEAVRPDWGLEKAWSYRVEELGHLGSKD